MAITFYFGSNGGWVRLYPAGRALAGRWLSTQSITQPIEPKLTIARVQNGLEVHPTVQSFL